MSALADQIAEVLRGHIWYFVGNLGVPGMPDQRGYKCYCGWETHADGERDADDPHLHVAERVVELFTEEWGIVTDMGVTKDALTEQQAHRLVDKFDDMTARRRFVSPWTAEEAKP